jgi:hypothetical protein
LEKVCSLDGISDGVQIIGEARGKSENIPVNNPRPQLM